MMQNGIYEIGEVKTEFHKVDKKILAPLFGWALVKKTSKGLLGTIKIQKDLPKNVENFIKEHEIFHIKDHKCQGSWIIFETRAIIAAAIKEPIGFLHTTLLTLTIPKRRSYYVKKILNRK